METRVLPSLPRAGCSQAKGIERVQWSNMTSAGCLSSKNLTSSQPLLAACSSAAVRPFPSIICTPRMQTEKLVVETVGYTIPPVVERGMQPGRLRMNHRYSQRSKTGSRRVKVRSFVDEATAHSADVEVGNSASGRAQGEVGESNFEPREEFREAAGAQPSAGPSGRVLDERGVEEGDEFGPGIQIIEADDSVDERDGYEDMRLGEKKDWSVEQLEKLDLLSDYEFTYEDEKGVLVVHAMRVEHMRATEELLVDSFAELMGGLLTYRPLLALTVRQYVRDRFACLPEVVTLVGLYSPAEDGIVTEGMEEDVDGLWLVAGTVELSFSNAGHPDIPSGPAPPPGSPYLCNMAVSRSYRRRGLGRQLLKAAEEVAVMMGAQDLYLHCRLVDEAPLGMYKGAGYQVVATDSILSLLTLQRRRYLMRKRLPELSLESSNGR